MSAESTKLMFSCGSLLLAKKTTSTIFSGASTCIMNRNHNTMPVLNANACCSKHSYSVASNNNYRNCNGQSLAVVTHPSLLLHEIPNHPESPDRLRAILDTLSNPTSLSDIELCSRIEIFDQPPQITRDIIALSHPPSYVDRILDIAEECAEKNSIESLDPDTAICPHSLSALMFAPACVTHCVDFVLSSSSPSANNQSNKYESSLFPTAISDDDSSDDDTERKHELHPITRLPTNFNHTFAAVRPPGHHAEYEKPMGFCIFNNIFIGAKYAQKRMEELYNKLDAKIAIVDFDVHHGNGTQQLCWNEQNILFISSHQFGDYFYPGSGQASETGAYNNILNLPLDKGSDGEALRKLYKHEVFERILDFNPDLIMISAGFDAHANDPLAQLNIMDTDYEFITEQLVKAAQQCCDDRIVSVLEGGYDLPSLQTSIMAHFRPLCG